MTDSEIDPTEIDFETYVEMKGQNPGREQDYPGITVGPSNWSSVYFNKKAANLLSIHHRDQFIAAPNPDAGTGKEFFICKTINGEGYSANAQHSAGASTTRSLVSNLGDQFDVSFKYELQETEMEHPSWGTPIFLAVPREKHKPSPRRTRSLNHQ